MCAIGAALEASILPALDSDRSAAARQLAASSSSPMEALRVLLHRAPWAGTPRAAFHGSSSCKVRWSMLPRPQRAQLSAAHCPRRAGVERSTSSTSSFNASTGTTSAWRRPPALLGRRLDATTGRLGPVAARAVRLVPSAASVRTWKVGGLL